MIYTHVLNSGPAGEVWASIALSTICICLSIDCNINFQQKTIFYQLLKEYYYGYEVNNKRQRSAKMIKNDREKSSQELRRLYQEDEKGCGINEAHGVKSFSKQNIQELIHVSKKCSRNLEEIPENT